jgi:hypothetical protein
MVLEEPLNLPTGETLAKVGQVVTVSLLGRIQAMGVERSTSVRVRIPTAVDTPTGLDPALLALLRKVRNTPPAG